jgi:hypothetical protein
MADKEQWHQPIDLTAVVTVNLATKLDTMYTSGYDQHAQAALLGWIKDYNPDEEDLFTAIHSIEHTRLESGFSRWTLYGAIFHRPDLQADNPDFNRLQTAFLTYFTQNFNGLRTYGDGVVFTRSDVSNPEGLYKYHRCRSLAYSNGCPNMDKFITETAQRASWPSSDLLPKNHDALELREHYLDVSASEYFRQNLLWLHIISLVQNSGNTTLLHEILHGREELPDNAGDTRWMPNPVYGKREVRFLARYEPFFGIVKPIWERYDSLCAAGEFELADARFSQNLDALANLIDNCVSIAQLATLFQPFVTSDTLK